MFMTIFILINLHLIFDYNVAIYVSQVWVCLDMGENVYGQKQRVLTPQLWNAFFIVLELQNFPCKINGKMFYVVRHKKMFDNEVKTQEPFAV